MKILITGATGLIGQEIVRLCHQSNIDVHYLTTNKDKITHTDNYKGYFWDPDAGSIDLSCFDDVEVIINLVGATVAKRWTSDYKKEIIDSRVTTANLLLASLKKIKHLVRTIVSASAIGTYPNSYTKYYKEDSLERGTDFLGEVVEKWETAVLEFEKLNIEVSILRIGLVLSREGGAFPKIAAPIQYGFGAVFGDGKHWQSWIHIQDLSRLFMFVVDKKISGIYNAVAPNPVSNSEFTKVIADVMRKKIRLPNVPKFAMQLILGDMHILLLSSQKVCSNKISEKGFKFTYDTIVPAIEDLIDR